MQVGITGGTGFVGSHLARRLADADHKVRLISRYEGPAGGQRTQPNLAFVAASITDQAALTDAVAGCDAVAHLAGIHFERGEQTFERVHVGGTETVVAAAEDADVPRLALGSYLRARPDCGSAYLESKWAAEECVRDSALDHTVCKVGVAYGRGDHMLGHLSRWLTTVPLFASVGFGERRLRPVAIEDVVDVLEASLTEERLSRSTVPVVGPEELTLNEAIQRVGDVLGLSPLVFPLPVRLHYAIARLQGAVLKTPVTSPAQVRMLAEGATDPAPSEICDPLPDDLEPDQPFSRDRIQEAVGDPRSYGLDDLRW